jgi:hypothetical protein
MRCERSELPEIARLVQRTLGGTARAARSSTHQYTYNWVATTLTKMMSGFSSAPFAAAQTGAPCDQRRAVRQAQYPTKKNA